MSTVLYHHYDQLVTATRLRTASSEPDSIVIGRVISALHSIGLEGVRQPGPASSRERVIGLPSLDIRLLPTGPFYLLSVHPATRLIHQDLPAAYQSSMTALAAVCEAFRADGGTATPPYLREVHLNADVVGWTLPRTPGCFRSTMDPHSPPEWEDAVAFGDPARLAIYNKSLDVLAHPEKGYVFDIYRQRGYEPDHGHVYRIEGRFRTPQLRGASGFRPTELWRGLLSKSVQLVRKRRDRDEYVLRPLWRKLLSLEFPLPAHAVALPPLPVPEAPEHLLIRLEGQAARALGELAAYCGVDLPGQVTGGAMADLLNSRQGLGSKLLLHYGRAGGRETGEGGCGDQ